MCQNGWCLAQLIIARCLPKVNGLFYKIRHTVRLAMAGDAGKGLPVPGKLPCGVAANVLGGACNLPGRLGGWWLVLVQPCGKRVQPHYQKRKGGRQQGRVSAAHCVVVHGASPSVTVRTVFAVAGMAVSLSMSTSMLRFCLGNVEPT